MLEYIFTGSITSTCLVVVFVGLLVYWLLQNRKYNYPPGPRGLPLLGNLIQIDPKILHQQVFEWSKQYGPVVTLTLGRTPVVYVNKIDAALEVLVKKSTDFAARVPMPSLQVLSNGFKDITFSSLSPTWKLLRRIATKALRSYVQGDALDNRISDAVCTVFDEIDKQTGEFDPNDYINFIVVNILTGICYGETYAYDDEEPFYLLKKEDEMMAVFGAGVPEDLIPGLKYVYKTKAYKSLEQITDDVIVNRLKKKYKEAKSSFDRDNIRHFCDHLILAGLEETEKEGDNSLTEDHLAQTVVNVFFAGIDTSRYTLSWAVYYMLAFPDIQEKVQEEIDRVVGRDRLPNIGDRPDLGYTEAVLHESMRLATVAPLGVMHMTSCDTDIAGYKIPKGTVVAVNHWALHHDPEAWEDVDRFIPERFLDEQGKLGPKPNNWLPFSAGKRTCMGEFVAKPELHMIFACLMQRYKWKMLSGKCADLTPGGSSFVLTSKQFKVIVERRK